MKHHHRHGGRDRHFRPETEGAGRGHGLGRRPFDYGALRLIVLGLLAEQPRHGYELMKVIEERMGGGYSPSPGVIYPTLSWLEDMGYAAAEADGSRKSYRVTPEGKAFLAANRDSLAELAGRMGPRGDRRDAPEPVVRAMDRLKRALRARLMRRDGDPALAQIATIIETAAKQVETIPMSETIAPNDLLTSTAAVATPKAAGYLAQLCKHFAHKIPATYEGNDGQIQFSAGACRLHAEAEALTLTVEAADAAGLDQLQDVVARHLLRFAFREELVITWNPA